MHGFLARQVALTSVSRQEETIAEVLERTNLSLDATFMLMSGYMVFLMQCGFAMLTAGSVRTKNTKNVLLKNLLDACVGALAYYVIGYALAYGASVDGANPFCGNSSFAMWNIDASGMAFWFFQWTFAATAATIVSGSVAERTSFWAYLGYAFFLTAFVYPVVSHWVWDGAGWLSAFADGPDKLFGTGMIDFAGCSVVHMVGGFAGLCGATIVGPRLGRFDTEGKVIPMPGHSATLCTLGTFILWFGWYGFNPGSALGAAYAGAFETISRCAVNTTLSAASAGLTTLVIVKVRDHIFDLLAVLNGVLAGLVSITACCFGAEPYGAIAIGVIGAGVYLLAAWLLLKLGIDDPLEAFPIHGACGAWGALCTPFFINEPGTAAAGFEAFIDGNLVTPVGLFYGGRGVGGRLLGANVVGVLVIAAWTCGLIVPMFLALKFAKVLRIAREDEERGNDVSKHGGSAYPEDPLESAMFLKDNMGVDDSLGEKFAGKAVAADDNVVVEVDTSVREE